MPIEKKSFAKHVYEKSGIYTIIVTGYNSVSSKTLNTTVVCRKNNNPFYLEILIKKKTHLNKIRLSY